MLPVATLANAIIFGSGTLHVTDRVKTRFLLYIAGIMIIALALGFVVFMGFAGN